MCVLKPASYFKKVSEDKTSITLHWQDGHESTFKADWLSERAFTPRARAARLVDYRGNRILWDARDFKRMNGDDSDNSWRFSYSDIMSKDSSLLAWLEYLQTMGIAMVVGSEPTNGQLRRLADRAAFVRRTHYGELFSVRAKNEPSNVAYTSEKLQIHTDLPYYEYKPGVNMLQCLVQWKGTGGENHLVDSYAVAELMRHEHPNEYNILSTTLVDWTDIGQEPEGVEEDIEANVSQRERRAFHSIYRAPVICEDHEGYIVRVNFSQPQRDSHFCVKLSQVSSWYSAFNVFIQLLHSPRYSVTYKLKEGEILTFDNLRICHGRGGYGTDAGMSESLERHVKGAYMDWDEVRSRIRTLRKKIRLEDELKVS
ncbi:gamma-butyrobetaine dioxygenase-like isoform X3 [Ischnura elegans]|uniref:gamma-butyrobetaine dioxygenase-like isoform X3 n=1 Tax=Ischnura elegans TaxID=197161 RepID=UPI001ED87509|nr:gamma-butyrobetaine dioxygenase-like isoform X3 [Ischnura elegans]